MFWVSACALFVDYVCFAVSRGRTFDTAFASAPMIGNLWELLLIPPWLALFAPPPVHARRLGHNAKQK